MINIIGVSKVQQSNNAYEVVVESILKLHVKAHRSRQGINYNASMFIV